MSILPANISIALPNKQWTSLIISTTSSPESNFAINLLQSLWNLALGLLERHCSVKSVGTFLNKEANLSSLDPHRSLIVLKE